MPTPKDGTEGMSSREAGSNWRGRPPFLLLLLLEAEARWRRRCLDLLRAEDDGDDGGDDGGGVAVAVAIDRDRRQSRKKAKATGPMSLQPSASLPPSKVVMEGKVWIPKRSELECDDRQWRHECWLCSTFSQAAQIWRKKQPNALSQI